eukprot:7719727-Lingulodinium_polyedra.AAC.1
MDDTSAAPTLGEKEPARTERIKSSSSQTPVFRLGSGGSCEMSKTSFPAKRDTIAQLGPSSTTDTGGK